MPENVTTPTQKRRKFETLKTAQVCVADDVSVCGFMSPMARLSNGFARAALNTPSMRVPTTPLAKLNSHGSDGNSNDSFELDDGETAPDVGGTPKDMQALLCGVLKTTNTASTTTTPLTTQSPRTRSCLTLATQSTPLRRVATLPEAQLFDAFERMSHQAPSIGDYSRPCALPTMRDTRHADIQCIDGATLAQLMAGAYDAEIASYRIIDCRYPYEYAGGHIDGAENIYLRAQLLQEFPLTATSAAHGRRHVLIFHCEFSAERAPRMLHFLRNEDRRAHEYPTLSYPELYLLQHGYKSFYAAHGALCVPQHGYCAMLNDGFQDECRKYHAETRAEAAAGVGLGSGKVTRSKRRLY